MPDMLVKLYNLPVPGGWLKELDSHNVVIRHPMAAEKYQVTEWVEKNFGKGWAGEAEIAFNRRPLSMFVAVRERQMLGFACHDVTCRNFFGPLGVKKEFRGRGIGRALLLSCLHQMAAAGYAYAIIGNTGAPAFYQKNAGAEIVEGSRPGIYCEPLI